MPEAAELTDLANMGSDSMFESEEKGGAAEPLLPTMTPVMKREPSCAATRSAARIGSLDTSLIEGKITQYEYEQLVNMHRRATELEQEAEQFETAQTVSTRSNLCPIHPLLPTAKSNRIRPGCGESERHELAHFTFDGQGPG
jgi:hypothetical protein